MVVRHATLLAAVDLHVGGVQVYRDQALGQRYRPLGRQQRQHPAGDHRQTGLRRPPLRRGDPPGQTGRGRGRQPGTGVTCWPAVSARCRSSPVRKSSPASCAAAIPSASPQRQTAIPLLDRADRRIQRLDHAQPVTQLADHSQTRVRRQRPIRRSGPHPLTPHSASTYPAHQIGVLSTGRSSLGSDHHPRPERRLSASTGSCHRLTRGFGSERGVGWNEPESGRTATSRRARAGYAR
jgi:hypothetical protein